MTRGDYFVAEAGSVVVSGPTRLPGWYGFRRVSRTAVWHGWRRGIVGEMSLCGRVRFGAEVKWAGPGRCCGTCFRVWKRQYPPL